MILVKWLPSFDALPKEVVKQVGDQAHFAASTQKEVLEIVANKAANPVADFKISQKAIEGDALERIKLAYPEIQYSEGQVFKAVAANTIKDRDNERFSVPVLDLFAKQINASPISMMWQHDPKTHGLGSMFHGEIVNGSDLEVYLFVPNSIKQPNQDGVKLVDAIGKYKTCKYVSIGFRAYMDVVEEKNAMGENVGVWTYIIDPSRPYTMNAYITEISLVHFPAQIGAGVKSVKDIEFIKEDSKKNMNKTFEIEINGKAYPIVVDVAGDAITAKGLDAITEAIKAANDAAANKSAADAAEIKTLREPLEADLVNAKIPALDAEMVKTMSAAKLIAAAADVTKGVKVEDSKKSQFTTNFE